MRLSSPPPCPKPCRVHDLVTVCVCTGGRGKQDWEQPEGLGTGLCGQDSGPGQVRLSSGLGPTLLWDSGSFLDPILALTCPAPWLLQLSPPCQGTWRVGTSWSHGAAFQVRGGLAQHGVFVSCPLPGGSGCHVCWCVRSTQYLLFGQSLTTLLASAALTTALGVIPGLGLSLVILC